MIVPELGHPTAESEPVSYVEIVRAGYAAIARGDLDAVSEFLAPDVRWHGGVPADGCQNRAQAIAWIAGRDARGAGPLPEIVDVVQHGARVVVVLRPHPSEEDPHPRLTASLITFRDGWAVEMVHHDDADAALAALGGPVPSD